MTDPHAVVEKELRAGRLSFTLGEAAARTGLPIEQTRDALDRMLLKYYSRLRITEKSEIIYDFGPKLRRARRLTLREIGAKAADLLLRAFRFVFRIWLTAMLICYFIVFALLALAAAVVALGGLGGGGSGSSRRRSGGGGGAVFDLLFRTLWSIFRWTTHTNRISRRQDRHGYPYRRFEPRPSRARNDPKSFVASVHDFVFGPEPVDPNPLANAREVAAFVRKERGILVASDLVALAGWTAEEADRFLIECSVRFEGEIGASDSGVIFVRFDKLMRDAGAADADDDHIEHYWDEYEPEYELTGNDGSRNATVIGLNFANLAFSGGMVTGSIPAWLATNLGAGFAALLTASALPIILGWIPLVFSTLNFVIPLIRAPFVARRNRRRLANNLRKRVMRAVFAVDGQPLRIDEVVTRMNSDHPEEKVTAKDVAPMLRRLRHELRGDDLRDDDMNARYTFPALALESRAASSMREQNVVDRALGKVIIDTGGVDIE